MMLRIPFLLFALLLLPLISFCAKEAPTTEFSFHPSAPLIGEPITVHVNGLNPSEKIQITARLKDELGRIWQSNAFFEADKKGNLDLSKAAAVSGTYSGIDPMGLFWSMQLDPLEKQRSSYWHVSLAPIEVIFKGKRANGPLISGKIIRKISAEGVHKLEIHDHGIVANLFLPAKNEKHPAIIVLGGSEGGIPNDAYVAQFANQGYVALGLAYYKAAGLPSHFSNIPLEYFRNGIDWLKTRPEVDSSRLAIVGSSTGGIAALLCASQYPDLRAVISIIGGPILFQSIDTSSLDKASPQSNFTISGRALPFVPIISPDFTVENLNTAYYLRVFLGSLFASSDDLVQQATIPVEKTNGPILLIGACNDRLLGSSYLNAKAYSRLTEKKFPFPYSAINYEGTGHTLGAAGLPGTPTTINSEIIDPYGVGYEYGGNPKDTARAQTDSWKQVFSFLKEYLPESKNSGGKKSQ
ncbi:MAG: acyl-CoA thioester hydrolase/BAAT C-terminal domain-containing protein [Chthoniobacterales bacterium]